MVSLPLIQFSNSSFRGASGRVINRTSYQIPCECYATLRSYRNSLTTRDTFSLKYVIERKLFELFLRHAPSASLSFQAFCSQMTLTAIPSNFSLESLSALRDVESHMLASLTFVVWDYFLTLEDEVEYIWPMRNSVFKWFYFYLRYFPVLSQICHQVVFPSLSSVQVPSYLCILWCRYMLFTLRISALMVELVLAARVFALFRRALGVGLFLGSLITLDTAIGGLGIAKAYTVTFYATCLLLSARSDVALMQLVLFLIVLSMMVGMTFFKHIVGIRTGWGRQSLLSFLVRDATGVYVCMFVICGAALVLYGLDDLRFIIVFFWSVSFYSAVGSRLILNIERFSRLYLAEQDGSVLLTTRISLVQ